MLRSAAAILVGFFTIGILSFITSLVVRQVMPGAFDAAGRTDSIPVLLLTQAYIGVFAVGGCYLAARLAPHSPMRHALLLGALGLAFNIVGTMMMWNTAPAWYHVLALALVMPFAWAGGRLREAELARAGGVPAAG